MNCSICGKLLKDNVSKDAEYIICGKCVQYLVDLDETQVNDLMIKLIAGNKDANKIKILAKFFGWKEVKENGKDNNWSGTTENARHQLKATSSSKKKRAKRRKARSR